MAKKEEKSEDEEIPILERHGLVKASSKIQAFKNRRCYPLEPFSLALALGKVDPITGLPGLPQGSIIEVAGAPGKGKTLTLEHHFKHVLADDPKNKVAILFFEPPNLERMQGLSDQGLDLDRIYLMDYSSAEEGKELVTAEQGLNILLSIAAEDPDLIAAAIDSIGGMPVRKEVMDDKGAFIGVDKTPQMAIRATILTRFINQWNTLDPNTRPTLFLLNHMKDQVEAGGFGLDPLKVNRIGENLNYMTPGGAALKYAEDVRIKIDGKKIEIKAEGRPVKHPLFDNNIQTGLEIHYEVYKNKFCGNQGSRRGIGRFNFATASFDIVDEVLTYASYLGVGGIVKGSSGMYDGVDPNKKVRLPQAQEFYKEHPDKLKELQKEIALHINELFGLIDKKTVKKEEKL